MHARLRLCLPISIMKAAVRRFACATTLIAGFTGCARQDVNRIDAHALPAGVHSIFVTGHRYHTGLVVRARDIPDGAWPARSDFPAAEYFELGWGEREYYPRDEPGVLRGLRALLLPSQSTINVIPITGTLDRVLSKSEIVELRVTEAAFMRMVQFVRQSHELGEDGKPIVIRSGVNQAGRFYGSSRTFHAFENCNVWVARALESAGVPVNPRAAVTAGMLLRQVRPLSVAQPAAT
jgi:hypothetical protein